eukprot:354411-Chlamydomonas_euryale.AAC.16
MWVSEERESQSYREWTHEGYACVERSKTEGTERHRGHTKRERSGSRKGGAGAGGPGPAAERKRGMSL